MFFVFMLGDVIDKNVKYFVLIVVGKYLEKVIYFEVVKNDVFFFKLD